MRKWIIIFVILLVVIIIAAFIARGIFRDGFPSLPFFSQTSEVTIGDQKFRVTIADEQREREIGLSEHTSLSENNGMLFLFPDEGQYSFWMRNMNFPIDIIFIRGNEIVTIHKDVEPGEENSNLQLYNSTEPADKVLELPAGTADEHGIEVGDEVTFGNLPTPKAE